MSKFKIGDEICWRRTGERAKVIDIKTDGTIKIYPKSKIYWSGFFFTLVTEPNLIMKDITDSMKLYFSLVNDGARECPAQIPTKAYDTDAGYDLYCTNSISIGTNEIKKIPTGVVCAIPKGFYGQINDRSSMGMKGAKCLAGVIDSGYRGEISVIMTNLSKETLVIMPGSKIAQLIIHSIYDGPVEVIETKDLPPADRQTNGFGSSGT